MFVILFALMVIEAPASAGPSGCDSNVQKTDREGNVGETALFPWLGVLRVHIHEGGTFRIALTGLVLVKEGYALANADDVARIPKNIFKHDSKAMFIPRDNEAWFCRLLDYMTHPEYRYATANTIALVELDPGDERSYPVKPICWPPYSFNTSNQLYAIGFTDENELLEKSIFSLQYIEKKLCKEFYTREGLVDDGLTPSHYQCGTARHLSRSCVWDNGMVLASNSSGHWTLVGFGIRGPGCAAPARFIDLLSYLPWVDTATGADDIPDQIEHYRKSAFNEGFRNRRVRPILRELALTPVMDEHLQHFYPFDTQYAQDKYYSVDRVEKDALQIRHVSVPGHYGNCSAPGLRLIYRDETRVVAKNFIYWPAMARVQYKISLYDLRYQNYTCVRIKLKSTNQDKATVYWRWMIDHMEGGSFRDMGDTPDELIARVPAPAYLPAASTEPTTTRAADWKPGSHLKVQYVRDKHLTQRENNYNILLTFAFEGEGILQLDVLGFYFPTTTSTTSTLPTITTTKKKRRFMDRSDETDEDTEEMNATDEVTRNPHEAEQREDEVEDIAEDIDAQKADIKTSALMNSFGNKLGVSVTQVIVTQVIVMEAFLVWVVHL